MELTENDRKILLDAACAIIRRALAGESDPPMPSPPPALMHSAGCFVSLHERRSHRLRGCMGRLDATQALLPTLQEIAKAVLNDPRFLENPVTLEELPRLELEISVLAPLRPANSPLDFDPLKDGIYLTYGHRAGCFLPQVARQTGWSKEQLLDRLCAEKMGLPSETWRDPLAQLSTFTVLVIGTEPFVSVDEQLKLGN